MPIGTEIKAFQDGFVEMRNDIKDLGTYCLFRFQRNNNYYTLLFAHLSKVVLLGEVKAGDVIAITGNTGKSTAPHLHTEAWRGLIVDRNKISTMTLDPMEII